MNQNDWHANNPEQTPFINENYKQLLVNNLNQSYDNINVSKKFIDTQTSRSWDELMKDYVNDDEHIQNLIHSNISVTEAKKIDFSSENFKNHKIILIKD